MSMKNKVFIKTHFNAEPGKGLKKQGTHRTLNHATPTLEEIIANSSNGLPIPKAKMTFSEIRKMKDLTEIDQNIRRLSQVMNNLRTQTIERDNERKARAEAT